MALGSRFALRGVAIPFAFVLLQGEPAAASNAGRCATAAEHAQVLRTDGKLAAARRELAICAEPSCPRIVQRDCATWQTELESAQPTIVVSVRDAKGADVTAARVSIDGTPVLTRIDGHATPIDPGEHDLRVEVDGGPSKTIRLVIREGEKHRAVVVDFAPPPESLPSSAPPSTQTQPSTSAPPESPPPRASHTPTLAYVFGGVGIVAVGAFAYLGLTGLNEYQELRDGCGRTRSCSSSDIGANRTKLWIADGALGVGIIAFGVAGWFLLHPTSDESANASTHAKQEPAHRADALFIDVAPQRGGASAMVTGHF